MAELKLFNTLTRTKEIVKPLHDNEIRMYTCGPTVYHYAHIGNFRTYVFEDLLRRTLKFFGFKVTQVMNLTDVDDKTIKGALRLNVSLNEFTQKYKDAFFADLKTLGIERAEHYPQATDYIPHMIDLIGNLIKKGMAYQGADGSIYFPIRKFPSYGCLSHFHLDELKRGASERVNADEYEKDSVSDFVLWKSYEPERDGTIYWESPYGKGRPGWHLECSAMAMTLLGETIDIHVGGVDNMFPHHENEIAQSESATGKTFANMWLHSEHLIVDNKKMSKSLGNFYTLRDLLDKGYSGPEVRYMLLHTHYKTQVNFTLTGLDSMRVALNRVKDFVIRLKECQGESTQAIHAKLEETYVKFSKALADDLNISEALAALFDLLREGNTVIDQKKMGKHDAEKTLSLLKKFDTVLGVIPFDTEEALTEELQLLLKKREEARLTKNWGLADTIRKEFNTLGFTVEDTPQGARLKKI